MQDILDVAAICAISAVIGAALGAICLPWQEEWAPKMSRREWVCFFAVFWMPIVIGAVGLKLRGKL